MNYATFPENVLNQRLALVRQIMRDRKLDVLVVSVPENIYYLTGLDHWGFFACHVLVIPLEGSMVLTCRVMERITVENQVNNAEFYGHGDTEEIADYVTRILADHRLNSAKLGIEKRSLFMTPRIYEMILAATPSADWFDASGFIDDLRLVKSPLEQEYARKASASAGQVYQAWKDVANSAGLTDYHRHHCGYIVSIGFPPSWTGGSMVTSLQPVVIESLRSV